MNDALRTPMTDRSRKVLQLATKEAQRLKHQFLRSEHILLGLFREGSGIAANVLRYAGVTIETLRTAVENVVEFGSGAVTVTECPLTEEAEMVLYHALDEAMALGHRYVGTEHLLLGLLWNPKSSAVRALDRLDLAPEDLRQEVLALLGHGL